MANAGNPALAQAAGPAAAQPGVYDQSAGAYSGALAGTGAAMAGPQTGAFMNPFTQSVTNRTMGDLETQRQMQMNNIGASATAAGAFGGSRHGVAEALTNEAFANTGANTFANLNMQGYDNALGAAQNQQNLLLNGANQLGGLANTGFNFGQQITNQQAQQGAMQQGLQQMVIDAAKNQFAGFTGAPQQAVTLPMAAVSGANMGQGTTTGTTTQQPGLFNYLSLGLGLL